MEPRNSKGKLLLNITTKLFSCKFHYLHIVEVEDGKKILNGKKRPYPTAQKPKRPYWPPFLLDPTQLDTLGLKPGDFYSVWNREIFRSMLALNRDNKPITWVHMYESLIGQPGHPNKPGEEYLDVAYMRSVFDSALTAVHLHADAALVKEKAVKRGLLVQVAQIRKKAQNGTAVADLDAMLVEARAGLQEPEAVAELFIGIGDLLAMEDKSIPWAIHEMLPHGALTIIAAEPGAGKSTWLRNLGRLCGARAAIPGQSGKARDLSCSSPWKSTNPWSRSTCGRWVRHTKTRYTYALIHSTMLSLRYGQRSHVSNRRW